MRGFPGGFPGGHSHAHQQGRGGGKGKGRDFYKILGVDKDADATQLKKAYRKMAMKFHPDRNMGNEAEATEKFKEVKEAFEVLSDPKKKKIYDRHGEEGLKVGRGGGGGMGDMFSRFFDGEEEEDDGRTEDIRLKMGVELKDCYNGSTTEVPIEKTFLCSGCKGQGTLKKGGGKHCTSCDGQGIKVELRQMGPFVTQQQVVCGRCRGEGVVINPKDACKTCRGKRVMQKEHVLKIVVEPGTKDGDKCVLAGESNQAPGQDPGDIIIFLVDRTPDEFPFQRKGDDLVYQQEISLAEALTGFQFHIKHMDDRTLVISSQPGEVIKPGSKRVVLGEGMPIQSMPGENGNLIVEFSVAFPGPEVVTEEVRMAIKSLLPPVPAFEVPEGTDVATVSEHTATDYVDRGRNGGQAYDSDDDQRRGPGGHPMQQQSCNYQ